MAPITTPRPADGLTAAQQVTLRETGILVSHRQAVQYLRDETRLKAIAAEAAQLHRILPSSITGTDDKPTRMEQRLSDFGVLGLNHDEPETAAMAGDIDQVMRMSPATRIATKVWRVGLRVLLAAALIGAIVALTGCGGGDDDEPGTGPNIDENAYVRCDNGRTAFSIEECRGMPPLPPAPAPATPSN